MHISNKMGTLIKKIDRNLLGYIGEAYVMYELAKRGIRCQKMREQISDFDLLTEFGDRIEVKCARPHWSWNGPKTSKTLFWGFSNYDSTHEYEKDSRYKVILKKRDRQCDFFIFVGCDWDGTVVKVFIVPKKDVGTRIVINEPVKRKHKRKDISLCLEDWKDKWDLLTTAENIGKEKSK